MATQSPQPLRGNSQENKSQYSQQYVAENGRDRSREYVVEHREGSREYRPVGDGYYYHRGESMYKEGQFPGTQYVEYIDKENSYPVETTANRQRSPNTYAVQQTRQYQHQTRMAAPIIVKQQVKRVGGGCKHHDFFVNELQNDINELRSRQRDFGALKEQFRYLQEQHKQIQLEKQKIEGDSLGRISEDRSEVDRLIRELDTLKNENYNVEEEQVRIIEQISTTEREVAVFSGELAGLRQQSSVDDQVNLNLRKEISYQEGLVAESKEVSHNAYKELTTLREQSLGLDRELETQHKRVSILRTEIENNEQRIFNVQGLLSTKEEAIVKCSMKIQECHQLIQEQKYTLNKLDGELGYFENQNEQHKNAQSQLFKANEFEYVKSKDNQLKSSELEVEYNKLEQDHKSITYEIDRLRQHSEQMMRDQIDLQSEVDALDKHMANLNNQNYCLQKELEGFIQADEQVRQGLDRKQQVQQIRSKVDDVIRRSEQEVETRVSSHKQQLETRNQIQRTQQVSSVPEQTVYKSSQQTFSGGNVGGGATYSRQEEFRGATTTGEFRAGGGSSTINEFRGGATNEFRSGAINEYRGGGGMTYENRVTPSYEQRAPVMSYENRGEFRSGATVDYRTAGAQYGGYNRQAVSRQEVVGGEFRGGARQVVSQEMDYRQSSKSANHISPSRGGGEGYVVEQRIAYRPEQSRNNGAQIRSTSNQNSTLIQGESHGPGENKSTTVVTTTLKEGQETKAQTQDDKKVSFADNKDQAKDKK